MSPLRGGRSSAGQTALMALLCLNGCSAIFDLRECGQDGDCPAPRRCIEGLCRPVPAPPLDASLDLGSWDSEGLEAGAACRAQGPEQPYNGLDDDCDPRTPDDDLDGDGFRALDDCDDQRAERHPGALDLCGDGEDWDCSGEPDQPCATLALDQARMRPTALAATPDGRLVVGFTPALEGLDSLVRLYDSSLELLNTIPVHSGRQIDDVLYSTRLGESAVWIADSVADRVQKLVLLDGPGAAPPVLFDLSNGVRHGPTRIALWSAVQPDSLYGFVGSQFGQAAWIWLAPHETFGTLADSPSPSLVGISWDGRRPFVVSAPDRRLRLYGRDARSQPVVLETLALPGVVYDLAVLPGRLLLLLADRVAVVNLDTLTLEQSSLPSTPGAFRMALGPDHRWLYLLTEGAELVVVDRPAARVLRQVDLRRVGSPTPAEDHRATDLVVSAGRVYVSLEGRRSNPAELADSFVAVVQP